MVPSDEEGEGHVGLSGTYYNERAAIDAAMPAVPARVPDCQGKATTL